MSESDDKPVGYKNPPKNYRFPPGHSGNPKGRRGRQTEGLQDNSFASILDAVSNETVHRNGREITRLEREIMSVQLSAAKGNVSASKFLALLRVQAGITETPADVGGVLNVPMPADCWSLEEAMDHARRHRVPCKLHRGGKLTEIILE